MRLEQRTAVARALHRRDELDRLACAQLVQGQREGPLDLAADLQPPRLGVDVRDVVVDQQVVEADGRHIPAERLERHPVVARRQLQLFDADLHA